MKKGTHLAKTKPRKKMTTQKDIAKALGISVAAVSKALNGAPDIGEDMKEAVRKKALELGYVLNATAKALRIRRSKLVGLIYSGIEKSGLTHDFFSAVLDAFRNEAEKEGYSVIFLQEREGMDYLDMVHYWDMDGVAIIYCDFNEPAIQRLIASSVPMAILNFPFQNKISVQSDSYNAGKTLIHALYDGGYRSFAIVKSEGGPRARVFKERVDGYFQALSEVGLKPVSEVSCAPYDPVTSAKATESILSECRPDVVVYTDDIAAMTGMTVLRYNGLKPFNDIGVVGFGGMKLSRLIDPVLTTFVLDMKGLGTKMASELVKWMTESSSFVPKCHFVSGSFQEGKTARLPIAK